MPNAEDLIKRMQEQIKENKNHGIEPDECSWNYQCGVIVSCNDAEFIIEALRKTGGNDMSEKADTKLNMKAVDISNKYKLSNKLTTKLEMDIVATAWDYHKQALTELLEELEERKAFIENRFLDRPRNESKLYTQLDECENTIDLIKSKLEE